MIISLNTLTNFWGKIIYSIFMLKNIPQLRRDTSLKNSVGSVIKMCRNQLCRKLNRKKNQEELHVDLCGGKSLYRALCQFTTEESLTNLS